MKDAAPVKASTSDKKAASAERQPGDGPKGSPPITAAAEAPVKDAAAAPSNPLLDFSEKELHKQYREGSFDKMSEQFLAVLDHLRNITYYALDIPTKHALNSFVKHFLYFMSQEDFVLSDAYATRFIDANGVIANMTAISDFGSTDPYLRILLGQQRNFTKLLAL